MEGTGSKRSWVGRLATGDATPERAEENGARARLLVAEDHPILRAFLCDVLTDAGFAVDAVEDGQGVLDRLAAATFDAALIDCRMPVLDGLETARRMRSQGLSIPIIFMSASDGQQDVELCLQHGEGFLAKPYTPEEVLRVVRRWL